MKPLKTRTKCHEAAKVSVVHSKKPVKFLN